MVSPLMSYNPQFCDSRRFLKASRLPAVKRSHSYVEKATDGHKLDSLLLNSSCLLSYISHVVALAGCLSVINDVCLLVPEAKSACFDRSLAGNML